MSLRDDLRIAPGEAVNLESIDQAATPGLPQHGKGRKTWARDRLVELGDRLARRQEELFANARVTQTRRRVLLVLQAMDCGGKDGTIRRVAGTMNPQGLSIVAFGKPTKEELDHDFLWRIRKSVPAPGQIGVFNRSHYEDVLVVRVHDLVPKRTWSARYKKINDFEASLARDDVTIVKVMLHISFAEQGKRLYQRLCDPTKYWKFNPADIDERAHWDSYLAAYADALTRCSTEDAPWYVVPADHRWYRDWAIATILADTLDDLGLHYPPPDFDVDVQRARLLAEAGRAGAAAMTSK
jgi:PPK2 family polyphosphate:nucleotide phosphotransferase